MGGFRYALNSGLQRALEEYEEVQKNQEDSFNDKIIFAMEPRDDKKICLPVMSSCNETEEW